MTPGTAPTKLQHIFGKLNKNRAVKCPICHDTQEVRGKSAKLLFASSNLARDSIP